MDKKISYLSGVDRPNGPWTLDEYELKSYSYWMTYDPIHEPEPIPPFVATTWGFWHQHGYIYAAEFVAHPATKGVSCRTSNEGYMALSAAVAPKPDEVPARAAKFEEFKRKLIANFEDYWGDFRYKGKVGKDLRALQELYARAGIFDLNTWTASYERFRSKLAKLSNGDLLDLLIDSVEVIVRKAWETHFTFMYTTFTTYMDFEKLCLDLLGFDDRSKEFQTMVKGFDNMVYHCDEWLWKLTYLAMDLGLKDVFVTTPEGKLMSKLEETENGRKWLEEFKAFLDVHGIRLAHTSSNMMFNYPTWAEKPEFALAKVKNYIASPIDYKAERQKIAKEREKAIAEALERIPSAKRREFKEHLQAAQIAYCWNEDHNYWIEMMGFALARWVALEMGRRMKEAGAIADPYDVMYFGFEELKALYMPAVYGVYDFHEFVERRKRMLSPTRPPLVTGEWKREEVKDPVMLKIFGLGPVLKALEKVDLVGYPGAPGVVEGVARVVLTPEELDRVGSGEILVTGATGPPWSFVFSRLAGVVTDMGGTLTHAAIMAREYGIPAVVGTGEATKVIKDGQRIRIDGNRGYVWILGK
jgi:pyruvate,water dikinase